MRRASMAPSSSSSAATTSVQVALRIRPPTAQDSTSIPARFQRSVILATSSTSVAIESPSNALAGTGAPAAAASNAAGPKKQNFNFDQVHSPPTTQYKLFDATARPLISRFLEGFNCTILAYGQTSSGKTFTMTGVDLDADPSDPNNGMGIIPRAVSTIFSGARQIKEERGNAWSFNLKASFIEIYNEDLIDLLSLDDPNGVRREVQIREDKEGHIIWGGLREVNVRNTNEVMGLLKKGTSFRQTNETDMNAQSSRSHAIFSLTLTQKKYTGSGPPPRSSSPLPPGGRSPSRLARPGSMYAGGPSPAGNRVASPTFGRPSTPNSFASAMGRGGLRPASSLGHHGERSVGQAEDERGEWVTIVSKFHFVDLAGSERLKRTAAAGERIKEGISINSGLLALGNVISALGDPARSKTTTHVPYRDSKLTRLLQDSLGGNAHTLMIACVSPAEWNANETVNTLKYANRARNIKNRAILNEKEDGWDDVEWLQGTVTRLRKDLKLLKEGGVITLTEKEPEVVEGAGKKVLAQLTELQNNYEDLREKYVERAEELTRLRGELGVKHRHSTSGAVNSTAKYEEIVGPVIEEYEKTINAMEAELNLNRAALRHTNEMFEEKEEECTVLSERHAATELYVEELRARVAKLTEREASTEAYVRDLEDRMKAFDETSVLSSESLTDLKRELVRFKDSEAHSSKYIADLEARLSRSDESIIALQQTVENLEADCERRREQAEILQSRLDILRQDGENWRTDLEAREEKVKDLEQKMLAWEQKRKDAEEARTRLGEVVGEVESARRSLQIDISKTSSAVTSLSPSPVGSERPPLIPLNTDTENELEKQLLELQQTHKATLADLSSITNKYRDALREISDLASQIQEAKLSNHTIAEVADVITDSPTLEVPPDTFRRRKAGHRVFDVAEGQLSPRRHFFRQAASAESLHARSLSQSQSQSLSQELSSVHSRKGSSSAGSSHSPSNSHSMPGWRPNSSISFSQTNGERSVLSLEKEIMRLQEVLKEREAEITTLEQSLKESQQQKLAQPIIVNGVDGEVYQIDDISDDGANDGDISSALSPKTLNRFESIRKTMENGHMDTASSHSEDESLERLNELMLSMAQKESQHKEVVDDVNAKLSQTRRQLDELTTLSRDQASNMSMEIEALQKKHLEDVVRLQEVQDRETRLAEELVQAEESHKGEIEKHRLAHEEAMNTKLQEVERLTTSMKAERGDEVLSLRGELNAATALLEKAKQDHESAFGRLMAEHEKELQSKIEMANNLLEETRAGHERILARLQTEHAAVLRQKDEEAAATLQTTEEEYYNALTKLRSDHADAIKTIASETNATIERLRQEHAGELRMAEIAKEGSLCESESASTLAITTLQEEHSAAIARKEDAFTEEIESLNAGFARALKAKEDDHTLQMDRLRLEHETTVSKLKSDWRTEVEHLNATIASRADEHSAALSKLRQEKDSAIRMVQEQQAILLQDVEKHHQEEISSLKNEYGVELQEVTSKVEAVCTTLLQSHTAELQALASKSEEESKSLLRSHADELHRATSKLDEERTSLIQSHSVELQRASSKLEEERTSLLQSHATELYDLTSKLEEERTSLLQSHTKELLEMKTQHEQAVAKLEAELVAIQESHRQADENMLEQHKQALADEQERLSATLADLQKQHDAERQTFRKDRDILIHEIEAHKAAADEFTMLRQRARQAHDQELEENSMTIAALKQSLASTGSERDNLTKELVQLRAELEGTRNEQSKLIQEAHKRESLVMEIEHHRSVLADLQESLQKVKDEKDTLQTERNRAETVIRDLQAQLARSASPPNARSPDRTHSFPRGSNGLPAIKLPPPTPPPSVPPPPAPRSAIGHHLIADSIVSTSSQGSTFTTTTNASSKESPESPSTSISHTLVNGILPLDPKVTAKLDYQTKQIEEQETMIKTLNKQLTHCETDLQTHMDLVTTLETSLGESEKNLRKARMQATEIARERDTLNLKVDTLRNELDQAKREVATVRKSIVEEKQSLEQRLDEERKAKERVRQQLDSRMDELQRRKSKFACL